MAHVVLDMNDRRPVWARPDWFAAELRAALPPDWTLAVLDTPTEGKDPIDWVTILSLLSLLTGVGAIIGGTRKIPICMIIPYRKNGSPAR